MMVQACILFQMSSSLQKEYRKGNLVILKEQLNNELRQSNISLDCPRVSSGQFMDTWCEFNSELILCHR